MAEALKERVVRGSLWTLFGHGFAQVARLASNLILTRLLFPEAFGLMALVYAFTTGMVMFSDMGLGLNVIQSKRGDDENFLDAIWTVSVIRGIVLFIAGCLLGGPAASFYDQPMLQWLVPAASIQLLINGFKSSRTASLNRHLHLARLTLWETSIQIFGLIALISFAVAYQSVWALVAGNLVSALYKTITSFWITKSRPRFHWEPELWNEIFDFGRWIFVSTILWYGVVYGDRLVLGKALSMEQLAVYSIAFMFAKAPCEIIDNLASRILCPVYAMLNRDDHPTDALRKIRRMRRILLALVIPLVAILWLISIPMVEFLYDSRYHDAGWILSLLAIGSAGTCLNGTIMPIMLAVGDSRRYFLFMIGYTTVLFTGFAIGWQINGVYGLLLSVACAPYAIYFVLISLVRKYGIWTPALDFTAIGSFFAFLGLVHMLNS